MGKFRKKAHQLAEVPALSQEVMPLEKGPAPVASFGMVKILFLFISHDLFTLCYLFGHGPAGIAR